MNINNIFNDLEAHADLEKAKQMEKYMKDQFQFLGIQSPQRRKIIKNYFKEAKKTKTIDWAFIECCWDKPYREAQYVAIDYLKMLKNFLGREDIEKIKKLLITKSWWDTIDGFHRMIGDIALKYPTVDTTMMQWSLDENIWLRRIAINHQMHRKEAMNEALFEGILTNNLGGNEFFINKAIGWALRDYSKTNPEWVSQFIDQHRDKLSSLSIREGSKYI